MEMACTPFSTRLMKTKDSPARSASRSWVQPLEVLAVRRLVEKALRRRCSSARRGMPVSLKDSRVGSISVRTISYKIQIADHSIRHGLPVRRSFNPD